MGVLIRNVNFSVAISLIILHIFGFWRTNSLKGSAITVYQVYGFFMFMFLLGSYIIAQAADMYQIWGNIPLMTGNAFLLGTNCAQTFKIVNILGRRRRIEAIIRHADVALSHEVEGEGLVIVRRCNRETKLLFILYLSLTAVTLCGWANSAEKNQLPFRAWYPYDKSKSPAFEITYLHQIGAIVIAALLNIAKDTLASNLIAQVRCNLQLLNLALRDLHKGIVIEDKAPKLLTPEEDAAVKMRLRKCVISHQESLKAASEIEKCFSTPIFAQFSVSMVIICVTAFQLASQTRNLVRLLSMGTYLLNMIFQVFIYCYQGNQLREESVELSESAYESSWYTSSLEFRRTLLVLMTRTRRPISLKAGGFTTLSLQSFMAIVKTSYSFFTVLQQVGGDK